MNSGIKIKKQLNKQIMIVNMRLWYPLRIFNVRYYFSHGETKKKFFKIEEGKKEIEPKVYPLQYPKHPLNDKSPIIPRSRPPRFLTPKYDIPMNEFISGDDAAKFKHHNNKWTSPENAYILKVGLIGPVNAGKSQLFGALSHHVSAVSPKASTTQEIITTAKSYQKQTENGLKNVQLLFYDTPGIMYRKEGFVSRGWKVLSQIDFSLLVVDCAKRCDEIVKESIKRLERHRDYPNFMKALVLNKVDLVNNRRKFVHLISQIEKYGKFDKIFYTSATTGYGVQELEDYLVGMAKQGEWSYPPETKTTLSQIETIEQLLRQCVYKLTYKQIPHNSLIKCTSSAELSNGIQELKFTISVSSQNQQRMLIGKQGRHINKIIAQFRNIYSQMHKKTCKVDISVRIRDRFNQKFPGSEQTMIIRQNEEQKTMSALDYFAHEKRRPTS